MTTVAQAQRYRAVVQLNQPGKARQEQALGNLAHILQAFQDEDITLELVAHGDGIELLLRGTPRDQEQMQALYRQGVRFLACGTTLRRLNLQESDVRDLAQVVPSAMEHLIRRQAAGWAYVSA